MAYFRCATGGGAGATITVTYTSDFYGETITCSHGTKTYTKVATSSGTVEFTVDEEGTWTISCLGFTDTADVDLSYEAELVAVPDGKTVLPTDDIGKWLDCGQIDGLSYTTLAQVLDDPETYERLLSDSNACDYMARSTTWASTICADADAMMRLGKYDYACEALLGNATWAEAICNSEYYSSVLDVSVPKMTSDTTPSGTVISSGDDSIAAWHAFDQTSLADGSVYTSWQSKGGAGTKYVGYRFTHPVKICKLLNGNSRDVSTTQGWTNGTFDVEASNDGETWTTIAEDLVAPATASTIKEYSFENDDEYLFYRIIGDSASYVTVFLLQFIGRHAPQTDIIVTAHGGDTVYYMDNGSPVTLTTADRDTGIGTVDWSDLPKGAITLYSSTAKNPSDLTADYSKTVYINENTTQIYLMPDNALYWWGYETSDIEDMNTTNGWQAGASGYSFNTPTRQTTYIDTTAGASKICNVVSKDLLSGDLCAITEGVTISGTDYMYLNAYHTKNWNNGFDAQVPTTTSAITLSKLLNQTDRYFSVGTGGPRAGKIYAIYREVS